VWSKIVADLGFGLETSAKSESRRTSIGLGLAELGVDNPEDIKR
jgi:hypothetical protein